MFDCWLYDEADENGEEVVLVFSEIFELSANITLIFDLPNSPYLYVRNKKWTYYLNTV